MSTTPHTHSVDSAPRHVVVVDRSRSPSDIHDVIQGSDWLICITSSRSRGLIYVISRAYGVTFCDTYFSY